MPRTSLVRPLAMILGAAVLAVAIISPRSEAQFTASPQQIGSWWPPHPRDQVQFYSPGMTLPSGSEIELFVVPSDRWLVIVPTGNLGGGTGRVGIEHSTPGSIHLVEDLGGVQTEKSRNGSSLGQSFATGPAATSALGWKFRPGSRVLLTYGGGQVAEQLSYNLFGYLTTL